MAKVRRYSTSELINAAVRNLIKAGWRALKINGHLKVKSPDGKTTLVVPTSPSDHRAGMNWIAHAKRMGVEVAI